MIKKYCKFMVLILVALFIAMPTGFAKEMTIEEVNEAVIKEEPYAGYYYTIGQYVFTSSHILTLEDVMLAARSIAVSDNPGGSNKDAIYGEMATHQFNAIWGTEKVETFVYDGNFTGTAEPIDDKLDICYINYKNICDEEEEIRTPENSVGKPSELDLNGLNSKVIEREPYAGYFYNIGQYIFTSSHILTLEDVMLAARTIEVSENSGATNKDAIYNEMATHQFKAIWGSTAVERFEYENNFTGKTEPGNTYKICYINYEKICSDSEQVDTKALIEEVYNTIKGNATVDKNEVTIDDNNIKVTIIDIEQNSADVLNDINIISAAKEMLTEGVDKVTLTYGTNELVLTNGISNPTEETAFLTALLGDGITAESLNGKVVSAKVTYSEGYETANNDSFTITFAAKIKPTATLEFVDETGKVERTSEFTVTTTANDYADKDALFTFEYDAESVSKLEYKDNEGWKEVNDTYLNTSFALANNSYEFRVTWATAGEKEITVNVVDADGKEYATANGKINVADLVKMEISTNIASTKAETPTEFTVTTTGNDYADKSVVLVFDIENKDLLTELKYYNGTEWVDIATDLKTPIEIDATDTTHKFQVIWANVGKTNVTIKVVDAADSGKDYASTEKEIEISSLMPATATMEIESNGKVGEAQEFTVKTTANDYAEKDALFTFEYDAESVSKLEYKDNEQWKEVDDTYLNSSFALANNSYEFRVTWATAGEKEITVNVVDADGKEYATTGGKTVDVAKGTATVTNQTELFVALVNENYDTINITSDIEADLPVIIDRDVTIIGNDKTITANYTDGTNSFITVSKDSTIESLVIDANNIGRGIKVTSGTLTFKDSKVVNGKAGTYAGGLYATGKSTIIIEGDSEIIGNSVAEDYIGDGYLEYSGDLWIGSEATGIVNGGEIGSAFVNENSAGNGGILTVNDGTVGNVYLEYEDGVHSTLEYKNGTVTNLYISTVVGDGDKVPTTNPETGTYTSGVPEVTTATVKDETDLLTALGNEKYTTIELANNIELSLPLVIDKDITILGNNNSITATDSLVIGEAKALVTLTGDREITLNGVTINANNQVEAVYAEKVDLVLTNSTVTGGTGTFGTGVYVTKGGTIEIIDSNITGNTVVGDYEDDEYLQYSSDLWIASDSVGTITSGNIGNAFVNANNGGTGGKLILNGGEVGVVYLEYEKGETYESAATLEYNKGTVEKLYVSTVDGLGDAIYTLSPEYGTYTSGVPVVTTATVKDEEELRVALLDEDIVEITLSDDITVNTNIKTNRAIKINGNGKTLTANYGEESNTLLIFGNDATIENLTVDAAGKGRGVAITSGTLTFKDSKVINGKADTYAGGLFATGKSTIIIEGDSVINGNSVADDYIGDEYLEYSGDLWIGSEATGIVNGGEIGSAFVNENSAGNGGILTVNDGTVENVYLEYEDGIYSTLEYNNGTVNNLYISTDVGDGDKVTTANPETGTYTSGLKTVVDVSSQDELLSALDTAYVTTINMTSDVELTSTLTIDRAVTINGDGKKLIATEENLNVGDSKAFITISGDIDVILNCVYIDANNKMEAVYAEKVDLVLIDSTVTGGTGTFGTGLYVTKGGTVEITNSNIEGNKVVGDYEDDNYLEYSSDLWIASDSVGTINSGEIGNAFVNENEGGTGGVLIVKDGTVDNVYLEYDDEGDYTTLEYKGGKVNYLHISTVAGNGDSVTTENPEKDTYTSGGAVVTTATVTTPTDLFTALGNEKYTTIVLANDIGLSLPLVIDRDITILGNENSITATDSLVMGDAKALVTLTGDKKITLNGVTINANNQVEAVYAEKVDLVLTNSTVTGGTGTFGTGLYVTKGGTVEIIDSDITGNTVEGDYEDDNYLEYSNDLWIASDSVGTITSGEIGNAFVNANDGGAGGNLIVNGGTVEVVYLEYDGKYESAGTLEYNKGTVTNLYISTVAGDGDKVTTVNPETGTYTSGVPVVTTATVKDEEELRAALLDEDIVEITLSDNITVNANINTTKVIKINGNGKTLTANYGEESNTLLIFGTDATIENLVIDANNVGRGVAITSGTLTFKDSKVINGKADTYAGGLFATGKSTIIIEGDSEIIGNSVADDYIGDEYLEYSGDLWIGSEATGIVNGGEIGSAFVNENSAGNGGILTVNDGTVGNVYLEYEDGIYSTLEYNKGTVNYLHISPLEENGSLVIIENPEYGTYNSGIETVVDVSNQEQLLSALNNEYIDEINLTSNVTLESPITIDRFILINGNGKTLTANGDIDASAFITVTGQATLSDLTIDANNLSRAIKVDDGILDIDKVIITGGKSANYASGIYVTNESAVTIIDSEITGNTVDDAYANSYLKYSSDLWIGSEASVLVSTSKIGNTFINANAYGVGGYLLVEDGTLTNVYVEYYEADEFVSEAILELEGGTINSLLVSTTNGNGDYNETSNPAIGLYSTTQTLLTTEVATKEDLISALSSDEPQIIKLTDEIVLDESLEITGDVTINANGHSITASNVSDSTSLITVKGSAVINNALIDAEDQIRAIKVENGNLSFVNSIIKGAKSSNYASGIYATGESNVEIIGSEIIGNTVSETYADTYLKYSSDVWVGSEAIVTIDASTIGNAFVNANDKGLGGTLIVNGSTFDNIYLEYYGDTANDYESISTLMNEAGWIENLHISTVEGNGNSTTISNPTDREYYGGNQ